MNVALLGGTGDIGKGLALRWGRDSDHTVVIGSRDAQRARESVAEYEAELADHGAEGTFVGAENGEAAARAKVVICAVPAYHLTDTIESVTDSLDAGDVLVSPAVGMKNDEDGTHYNRPGAGSVTALADRAAPDKVSVVGAFHSLPAGRLADLRNDVNTDTIVVGDETDAVETVASLAADIDGLRARYAGPLANAAEVEALTPLLINLARNNDDLHDVWVKFD